MFKSLFYLFFWVIVFNIPLNLFAQKRSILVFSKTQGYRHESIVAGQKLFFEFGKKNNYQIDTTENVDLITESNLKNYQCVVFLNTTGTLLEGRHRNDLERFIQAGGGFVGIHAATDTEYDWPWYHQMLGATFKGHPASPNVRTGKVDFLTNIPPNHPAPNLQSVLIEDEFYDFKNLSSTLIPLAYLDESSYKEENVEKYHPIAWINEYDGGRVYYMGLGHQPAIYTTSAFKDNLFLGLSWVLNSIIDYSKSHNVVSPDPARFEKNILVTQLDEPIEIAPLPNNKVLIIERKGKIKVFQPSSKKVAVVSQLDVFSKYEYGLLGISIDPDFEHNSWVYLYYTPNDDTESSQYLARFTFVDSLNTFDISSKKIILKVPIKKDGCCHTGGSMAWDLEGNLFLSTGDDTSPGDSEGYSPIDFRKGRKGYDALATSANTNDLRGKILRIRPTPDGSYRVPKGNLFPENTQSTLPEIYIMGCRNPYRISFDKKKKILYWGDIGPDAGKANPERGPEGYVEFNAATKPGNFGWPMFIGENIPYRRFDFDTKRAFEYFDVNKPINSSPNNTGLRELPLPQKSFINYNYSTSNRFPILGKGGCNPMAGPVYYEDEYNGDTKFPTYFNEKFFAYEWMRDWVISIGSSKGGIEFDKFFSHFNFSHPIDIEFGKNGTLYVLDYGVNWFQKNEEATLSQIEYVKGNRKPIVKIKADKQVGVHPLVVRFDASESYDPDNDSLSYRWDFGGKKSSMKKPIFTFTKAGEYLVKLVVSDKFGNNNSQLINITSGNSYPKININISSNKTFNIPNKSIRYRVSVADKEDGYIGKGISLKDIALDYELINGYDKTIFEQRHQSNILGIKGQKLIENNDCKSCHSALNASVGPTYNQIANKYEPSSKNIDFLSKKIISGGKGSWGEHAMSAHPQLNIDEAKEMVDYILNINKVKKQPLPIFGEIKSRSEQNTLIIKASYTDKGKGKAKPLTSSIQYILRPTILNAINCDFKREVGQYIHSYFGYEVTVANANESFFGFKKIDFLGISSLKIYAYAEKEYTVGGSMEVRLDSPNGPKIGGFNIKVGEYKLQEIKFKQAIRGTHDLYFIYRHPHPENKALFGVTTVEFCSD